MLRQSDAPHLLSTYEQPNRRKAKGQIMKDETKFTCPK
jgi:hypothetical protein